MNNVRFMLMYITIVIYIIVALIIVSYAIIAKAYFDTD